MNIDIKHLNDQIDRAGRGIEPAEQQVTVNLAKLDQERKLQGEMAQGRIGQLLHKESQLRDRESHLLNRESQLRAKKAQLRVEQAQLRVELQGLTAKAEAIFEETVPSIAAKTEGNFAQGTIAEFALSY